MSRTAIAVPLALALLSGPSAASEAKAGPQEAREEAAAKGLKSRLFVVQNARPHDLAATLRLLGSGAPGSSIQSSDEMKTITARDYPENLAQMGDAIQRLDVAGPSRSDVDLTIHVLEARKGDGAGGDLPADLRPAVAALKGTLAFRSYHLLTTFTQRVKDGTRGVHGGGEANLEGAEPRNAGVKISFDVGQVSIAPAASGPAVIRLDGFRFVAVGRGQATIDTGVSLKEGEQVVVGTSALNDRGLVLVVSGRTVK